MMLREIKTCNLRLNYKCSVLYWLSFLELEAVYLEFWIKGLQTSKKAHLKYLPTSSSESTLTKITLTYFFD